MDKRQRENSRKAELGDSDAVQRKLLDEIRCGNLRPLTKVDPQKWERLPEPTSKQISDARKAERSQRDRQARADKEIQIWEQFHRSYRRANRLVNRSSESQSQPGPEANRRLKEKKVKERAIKRCLADFQGKDVFLRPFAEIGRYYFWIENQHVLFTKVEDIKARFGVAETVRRARNIERPAINL